MDITSYPLSERNTSLLLFLMPLSATSGGCAQSIISIISIQACTGLGIASLLECRWCLARINFSPLPQGMKNNPMAKTQAWSSGKILSSLLLCTFPFWPWPRDLLSHRRSHFYNEGVTQTHTLLTVISYPPGLCCLHSYPQLWAHRTEYLAGCSTVIFDRASINRDVTLCLKKDAPLQHHGPWVPNLNQWNQQWAKTVLSFLCKAGVGKPTQWASCSFHSKLNFCYEFLLGRRFKKIQF